MDIISVGHINFLLKVELPWVQGLISVPMSSYRLPTNTLHESKNHLTSKVVQKEIITHVNFLGKQLL